MNAITNSKTEDGKIGEIVDDFLSRVGRGERPDIEALASMHPQTADILRYALPALRAVAESIGGRDRPVASESNAIGPDKPLGDFRLGRELGRGGMGVVFEAEQISMGRTVALKILPFAAVMDEKAITRFKNEARAAGTLHHDNIVPIHAVGNERGVYYYAMSLIRGMTLAQVIDELRQRVITDPRQSADSLMVDQVVADKSEWQDDDSQQRSGPLDPTIDRVDPVDRVEHSRAAGKDAAQETRRLVQGALTTHRSLFDKRYFEQVARIGIEAAEALDHAHEHGILHRDIKPANLMVDATGKLWVTDFGLARIESDAGMTMTGDLLGTLRYMAPEQALAKRIVVDHRADVYSLGVTLYELITLRPAFDGADRESLLKQLTFEEPKPLRHFHPGVPGDLETIVHKAIAKNPDERYGTAQELAEDLRAFNQQQPINAKPLSALQRTRKWARRHSGLVAAAAVVMIVSTLALAASALAIAKEQSQTEAALDNAQVNLEESERQRKSAEENSRRAREAVDTYLTRVSEDKLLNEPGLQPLRRDLLQLALKYYEQFIEERGDDAQLQLEYTDALYRAAEIQDALGADTERVVKLRSQSLEIRRRLFEQNPQNDEYRNALAESYLMNSGEAKVENSIARLEKAIDLARSLTAPKHRLTLAKALADLGKMQRQQFKNDGGIEKMEMSHKSLTEAIEIFEDLEDKNAVEGPFLLLPRAHQLMAVWHLEMDDSAGEKRFRQKAMERLERLAASYPKKVKIQIALADSFWNEGDYERAIEIDEKLAKENPLVTGYQLQLANSYSLLGKIRRGEDEAVELSRKSTEILTRLTQNYPERMEFRNDLAVNLKNLAFAQRHADKIDDAIESSEAAIKIFTETGAYPGELADAYTLLSRAHEDAGRLNEAIDAKRKSRQLAERFSDNQLHFQAHSAHEHRQLGDLLRKAGRIDEAIVTYQQAVNLLADDLSADQVDGLPYQIEAACDVWAHNCIRLLTVLNDLEQHDEAAAALQKAIRILELMVAKESTRFFALKTSRRLLESINENASTHRERLRLQEMLDQHLEAELKHAQKGLEQATADNDQPVKDWSQIAFLYYGVRNWQGAEKEARRAIKLAPDNSDYLLGIAPLLLMAGETEEYRQLCARLLDAPIAQSAERQAFVRNCTVRLCGLDPNAAGASERVLDLALQGVTPPNNERYYFIYALGRAYYRAGQYEKAVETLERALAKLNPTAEPLICLDLAIAHHRWGREKEAQEWYERAKELLDGGQFHSHMHELAETTVLRHEAEQLLGKEISNVP